MGAAVGVAFISSLACRKPLHFSNDYFALLLRLPLRSPQSRGAGAHLVAHDGRAPRALSGWATPRESRWAGRVALPFSSLAFQKKFQSLLHSFNGSPLAQASTAQPSEPRRRARAFLHAATTPRALEGQAVTRESRLARQGWCWFPSFFYFFRLVWGGSSLRLRAFLRTQRRYPPLHSPRTRTTRAPRALSEMPHAPARVRLGGRHHGHRQAPLRRPRLGRGLGCPSHVHQDAFPPLHSPRTRTTRAPRALSEMLQRCRTPLHASGP